MAHDILVLAESLQGELAEATFEVLGAARQLADAWQVNVQALLVGRAVSGLAARLTGADKVWVCEVDSLEALPPQPVAALLHRLVGQQTISLVLLAGTNLSLGIGSVLAARLRWPAVNFCQRWEPQSGALRLTCQLLGGKMFVDVTFPERRGVLTISSGAFPPCKDASRPASEMETIEPPDDSSRVRLERLVPPETGDVDITRQAVLVAVGRGLQRADNVTLAEELARLLGGAVAASRPVIDQGWLPLSRQVGKSGMTVNPRLYLALGISGAPEHWKGMRQSQLIVAVNTDPQAPIFDGAHYGICADALELLPALIETIKARKG